MNVSPPNMDRLRASEPVFRARWMLRGKRHSPLQDFHYATNSIFVHIPKCGGMSVLRNLYGTQKQHGHTPAAAYRSADPAFYKSAFVFTFVRDPIARFVSAYTFLKQGGVNDQDREFGQRALPWDNMDEAVIELGNHKKWDTLLRWKHFRPQYHFVSGHRAGGKYGVDFIGRQDQMQDGLDYICDRLGHPRLVAKSVNVTKRPADVALSAETQAIVAEKYAADMELWDLAKSGAFQP